MPKKYALKVYGPVADSWSRSNNKFEQLFIRRDAYLSNVLNIEINRLSEISTQNSEHTIKYIKNEFKKLDTKTVYLTLDESVMEKLDRICSEKKVLKEAFYNRIFFLLSINKEQFKKILGLDETFDKYIRDLAEQSDLLDIVGIYPLDSLQSDPFLFIHDYFKESGSDKLYQNRLLKSEAKRLDGLHVLLNEAFIPEEFQSEATKLALEDF